MVNGKKYAECLKLSGKKLFLTATPSVHHFDYKKEECITSELDESRFGKVIHHLSLANAINRGWLTGYRLLIHNKPSTNQCYEHVSELMNIFGRKKIIVFYNRRKDAKEAQEHLSENGLRGT